MVLATGRLAEALTRSGSVADAAALLDGQAPTDHTSPLAATLHHLSRAVVCLMVGRYPEGVAAARRALTRAEAFGDPRVLASVLSVQREQARRCGRLREALEKGHRALDLALRSGDPVGVAFEQANLAELHLLLDEALAVASARTDRQAEYEARTAKAEWLVREGYPDEALSLIHDVRGSATVSIEAWAHLRAGRLELPVSTAEAEVERAGQAGECLAEGRRPSRPCRSPVGARPHERGRSRVHRSGGPRHPSALPLGAATHRARQERRNDPAMRSRLGRTRNA